jgi:hypothetical protein
VNGESEEARPGAEIFRLRWTFWTTLESLLRMSDGILPAELGFSSEERVLEALDRDEDEDVDREASPPPYECPRCIEIRRGWRALPEDRDDDRSRTVVGRTGEVVAEVDIRAAYSSRKPAEDWDLARGGTAEGSGKEGRGDWGRARSKAVMVAGAERG